MAAANEVPIGPGAGIEDAGRGIFQYLAVVGDADNVTQGRQILGGAIDHQMREKLPRIGESPLRLIEPDHAAGDAQQLRRPRQCFHDLLLLGSARRTCGVKKMSRIDRRDSGAQALACLVRHIGNVIEEAERLQRDLRVETAAIDRDAGGEHPRQVDAVADQRVDVDVIGSMSSLGRKEPMTPTVYARIAAD